jgi:hypothetical protein
MLTGATKVQFLQIFIMVDNTCDYDRIRQNEIIIIIIIIIKVLVSIPDESHCGPGLDSISNKN